MIKVCTAVGLFILLTLYSFSQKEANNWYFGNEAALDFGTGVPIPVNGSLMNTGEGCSSISDKTTGALLFYTDGVSVWDKTNTQMPNGFGLFGNSNTTQSALIVPWPEVDSLYFIFTVDATAGYSGGYGGFAYSVVDMSLNGGDGDVIIKNQQLLTPTTEKAAAVYHCNGRDVWVATHKWKSDSFFVYPVTQAGVGAPVITKIGPIHSGISNNNLESVGYLKFSPDGTRIAEVSRIANNNVEIYYFDNNTGLISNPIYDTYPSSDYRYGLTFSPDNSKLYVSTIGPPRRIYQYNLAAGSNAAVIASKTIVASNTNLIGAMQIAYDGKIYIANWPYSLISVINNPNAVGAACNYVPSIINLGSGKSSTGLPNFIESYFNTSPTPAPPEAGANDTIAYGANTMLSASGSGSYTWTPSAGLSCTACENPVASPLLTTTYYVTTCYGTDSVTVFVEPPPIPCGELFIPNAFSPNGDGENDVLYVKHNCIQTMVWEIFNRWGEKVFESSEITTGWDGMHKSKKVNTGIYYYLFRATFQNGEEVKLEGNVALLR